MEQSDEIIIPLSKKKILLLFFGAMVFVAFGALFMITPSTFRDEANPIIIFIVGLVAVLFFGFVAMDTFRKLFDKKAGLIINEQGIIDNSDGFSIGLVLWSDIKKIRFSKMHSVKLLTITIKNPKKYIRRVSNPIKRKMLALNSRYFGSPIQISSQSLQTDFDSLERLLTEKFKTYQDREQK